MSKPTQTALYRWSLRFGLAHCLLFYLVGWQVLWSLWPLDLPFFNNYGRFMVGVFIGFSYIGHFALLALLGIVLPCLALSFVLRRPKVVIPIATTLATLLLMLLLIDGQIYSLYRMHFNSTFLLMATSGYAQEMFAFSGLEWTLAIVTLLAIAIIETWIARALWHRSRNGQPWKKGWIFVMLFGALLISYWFYLASLSVGRNEYTIQSKAFPLYDRMLSSVLPEKYGYKTLQNWGNVKFTQAKMMEGPLTYPIKPLQCEQPKSLPNILIVVIDTWRFDSITREIMPNMLAFSNQALYFNNHYSGGNGTKAGMFSLFYGLPSNYFASMLAQAQPPLLLQRAKELGYRIGVFSSSEIDIPNFKQTIFLGNDHLFVGGSAKNSVQNDQHVTDEYIKWRKTEPKKPFLAVAYYNIAHAYCEVPLMAGPFRDGIEKCNRLALNRYTDPIPYLHRYFNTLNFSDKQVQALITDLKNNKLWENTVIVVTGDHGQEYNDNKQNYWEHANNFTRHQVQTPMIVHWPNHAPETMEYRTTHYDVVPTLMKQIFTCNNPPDDYSIGYNLFDSSPRNHVLVGSYINFGIVEAQQTTVLWQNGDINVQGPDARTITNAKPNIERIRQVLQEMRRFYRK